MQRASIIVLVASIIAMAASISFALYGVTDKGGWPKNWPTELEPLRNQSRTLTHSQYKIHEIPFACNEDFEAAWLHILAVKSKEAPLILLRSPNKYRNFGETIKAGVRILSPRTGTLVTPEGSLYPPGAESVIPEGKFLRIGPPWPDHIKSESETLPEYVINENGKWAAYDLNVKKDPSRYLRRARIDIELVVDGDIVDLNRIPLPANTPIIDKRFR